MTGQSKDTIKDELGEPACFIGLTYRTEGEGLFMGSDATTAPTPCPSIDSS